MGCGESKYKQKGPNVKGRVIPLYTEGLAYKIVQTEADDAGGYNSSAAGDGQGNVQEKWYLYNDTKGCLLRAEYCFGPQSVVQPFGPAAKADGAEADNYSRIVATVQPGKTEKFIIGRLNGYRSNVLLEKIEDNN